MLHDYIMTAKRDCISTLVSIQVGLPQDRGIEGAADPMESRWMSGFIKEPVTGPVWLGRLGLDGDGQADLENHGGPDKAVLAYAEGHYPGWRAELGLVELAPGGFGENLTVRGLDEASVCLGDQYAIGAVRVEVSQPRLPCWKLARRWGRNDLPKRVVATNRSGWYLRVITEGTIEAGLDVVLLERPLPQWTIVRLAQARMERMARRAEAAELAACPYLAEAWRSSFTEVFEGH